MLAMGSDDGEVFSWDLAARQHHVTLRDTWK
jgi:hypothetical protein